MRYKLLGRTGLRVSELCLGAMIFGDRRGGWGASKDEAAGIVERFAEAGGNVIDTANSYAGGESERIVGELIARSASAGCCRPSRPSRCGPTTPTAAAPTARAWCSRWRRACGGSAPATSAEVADQAQHGIQRVYDSDSLVVGFLAHAGPVPRQRLVTLR